MIKILLAFIAAVLVAFTLARAEVRHKPCEYFKTSDTAMMFVPSRCVVGK